MGGEAPEETLEGTARADRPVGYIISFKVKRIVEVAITAYVHGEKFRNNVHAMTELVLRDSSTTHKAIAATASTDEIPRFIADDKLTINANVNCFERPLAII